MRSSSNGWRAALRFFRQGGAGPKGRGSSPAAWRGGELPRKRRRLSAAAPPRERIFRRFCDAGKRGPDDCGPSEATAQGTVTATMANLAKMSWPVDGGRVGQLWKLPELGRPDPPELGRVRLRTAIQRMVGSTCTKPHRKKKNGSRNRRQWGQSNGRKRGPDDPGSPGVAAQAIAGRPNSGELCDGPRTNRGISLPDLQFGDRVEIAQGMTGVGQVWETRYVT